MAQPAKANQALPLRADAIPRYVPGSQIAPDVVRELAARAYNVLRYKPLATAQGVGVEPLSSALNRLGIEILDRKAVEEYKTSKTRPDVGALAVKGEDDDEDEPIRERNRNTRAYVWDMEEIDEYSRPIPERVLAKAVQVKEACPRAVFHVHSIVVKGHEDPFLEVSCNGEAFFIDVWDEPNFSGKVTAEDAKRAGLKSPPNA